MLIHKKKSIMSAQEYFLPLFVFLFSKNSVSHLFPPRISCLLLLNLRFLFLLLYLMFREKNVRRACCECLVAGSGVRNNCGAAEQC